MVSNKTEGGFTCPEQVVIFVKTKGEAENTPAAKPKTPVSF